MTDSKIGTVHVCKGCGKRIDRKDAAVGVEGTGHGCRYAYALLVPGVYREHWHEACWDAKTLIS